MLTALEIANFKGVASKQRVEFSPLTLLFGANSAGKSSILHALVYLQEILQRGEADVDRTLLGGETIELGGFARLIHRHERTRTMSLRVEWRTPASLNRSSQNLDRHPFRDLDDATDSAWLELSIQHRRTTNYNGPAVTRARLGVGQHAEPLVWLDLGPSCHPRDPLYARVNLGHPSLGEAGLEASALWEEVAIPDITLASIRERERQERDEEERSTLGEWFGGELFEDGRALPVFAVSRARMSALPAVDEPIVVLPPNEDDLSEEQTEALEHVRTFLELVVTGTTAQLATTLNETLYIGPLRIVPARGFLYQRAGRVTRWADGLAAWDLLLSDRSTLVERTNAWLARLGAGCKVVVQQLVDSRASAEDLSAGHVDSTVRRLLLDTGSGTLVLPSEVGAGISQMVPIIVASLIEGGRGLALVEQPEIHVHPALQVGLGDMFLDAARQGRQFLIETHSEHLLLRLMRRMRETSEGTLPDGSPPAQPSDVKVWFVEREPGGCLIRNMPLNERGDLVKAWPGGFFEEGLREVM
jgi:predicted ATPase